MCWFMWLSVHLSSKRRTILACPCSTARQRAGLGEVSTSIDWFDANITWRHPQVGSWCLSRGHCQAGWSEPPSPRPWRRPAITATLNASSTSTTTWVPPRLLSADASVGATPPWCTSCLKGESLVIVFLSVGLSYHCLRLQTKLKQSSLLTKVVSAVWKQLRERLLSRSPLSSWSHRPLLFNAFLRWTSTSRPRLPWKPIAIPFT